MINHMTIKQPHLLVDLICLFSHWWIHYTSGKKLPRNFDESSLGELGWMVPSIWLLQRDPSTTSQVKPLKKCFVKKERLNAWWSNSSFFCKLVLFENLLKISTLRFKQDLSEVTRCFEGDPNLERRFHQFYTENEVCVPGVAEAWRRFQLWRFRCGPRRYQAFENDLEQLGELVPRCQTSQQRAFFSYFFLLKTLVICLYSFMFHFLLKKFVGQRGLTLPEYHQIYRWTCRRKKGTSVYSAAAMLLRCGNRQLVSFFVETTQP